MIVFAVCALTLEIANAKPSVHRIALLNPGPIEFCILSNAFRTITCIPLANSADVIFRYITDGE